MALDQVDQAVASLASPIVRRPETAGNGSRRIVSLAFLFRGLIACALLVPVALIAASPVAAASVIAPTTTCGSGLGNLGGRGLICQVTIVNTITASGGAATVTVRECLGSAGDPTDGAGGGGFACSTKTATLTQPVTAVTQCNGSTNGGGGTLRCSVKITNNFVGVSPGETTVTVNQCVGSGASGVVGLSIKCNPVKADTGASVTQCNGSANGGTLVGLTCTVTGKMAAALPITINQGNGSTNGGGALIIASVILINNTPAAPTPSPSSASSATPIGSAGSSATPVGSAGSSATPVGSATAGATATPPATGTIGGGSSNDSAPPVLALLILLISGGLGLATIRVQRRSIPN